MGTDVLAEVHAFMFNSRLLAGAIFAMVVLYV